MKIRVANKYDLPQLKQMLWNYHDSGNIKGLDITSEETGLRILSVILAGGGIALISEKDHVATGMLLAVRSPFLWDNTKSIMTEIAYWVEPEYRGSTAGYRLLKEYVEYCDNLKDLNKISNYTISQMEGQELNYSRFGFKPIEHTWSV